MHELNRTPKEYQNGMKKTYNTVRYVLDSVSLALDSDTSTSGE